MALAPKRPKKDRLALALDHVEIVARGPASFAPYCQFSAGWLIGYDGIVAAGARTPEVLPFAPETSKLRVAVAKAGTPYSLNVTAGGRLSVRGETFRADVLGFPLEQTPNVAPDFPSIAVGEQFATALKQAGKAVSAKSEYVVAASVLVKAASVVGTTGSVIIEAAHGAVIPQQWLLPVEFVTALESVRMVPTSLGVSNATLTLWFGEEYWLRCAIYSEAFPDTDMAFMRAEMDRPEWRPVAPELAQTLEMLKPFLGPDKLVLITPYYVACVLPGKQLGASVQLMSHMQQCVLPWSDAVNVAKMGQWCGVTQAVYLWQADSIRGAIILPGENA